MRIHGVKHSDLEDELFEWFCHAHAKNIPVEGPMVKEQANEIALKMGLEFQCSNGWLQRFKQQRNITWQAISGESSAADVEASDKWRESVAPIIEQYVPQDIFNMDEMALFYNAQQKRTLDIKGEKCHGGKAYKDRATVLLCCNADGSEKLRPLVVGKSEKPQCMKGVKHYLCNYKASKSAWLIGKIFRERLLCLERKMACKNRNVLKLLN
jgi:hypothetical protein